MVFFSYALLVGIVGDGSLNGAANADEGLGWFLSHRFTLALALWDISKPMRTAIHLRLRIVARRHRAAMAISPGAFWRARPSSSSLQPHRLHSPPMIRSARLAQGSRRNLPLAHSPLGQRRKKILAIHVVEEGLFAAIVTANNVVNSPVIYTAHENCPGSAQIN